MKKEKPTTKICKYCKTEIPLDAKVCRQCRKKQGGHGCLTAIGVVVAIGVLGSCFAGGGSSTKPSDTSVESSSTIADSNESGTETTTTADTGVEETTATEANIPTEYKSALKKAETYSNTMHMSKVGIYNQLTSEYGEKFSTEAAQYAVDNMTADWNANALAKAQEYSKMNMSKAGIYDQLVSEYGENFTAEEAQYAVDNMTADWNANALAKAKTYQETMNMSPEAIRDQLTSDAGEKFTQEEADYAISHLE